MSASTIRRYCYLLILLAILPACQADRGEADQPPAAAPTTSGTVSYDVVQEITLKNDGPGQPNKHNLWVALISDQEPYQEVSARTIQPSNFTVTEDEYGNQYAEFDLKDLAPGETVKVTVEYEIAVNELTYALADCVGDLPDAYTQPEQHIESLNPQVVSLAEELSSAGETVCEQVKSFYDYIGDNLTYTYNGDDWGAQAALGEMGADCTEFSSLLIALSRARGIPARYVRGLLYLDENTQDSARKEHAWAEVFFPGAGWTPIDPTLGRLILTRDSHFARYSPNHIIVTNGRNPSTLRGANYWSHLYWPGDSADIRVEGASWTITPMDDF
ncbi:MAG: transglutaminase-like domain-containing protein [Candidatus Promineifilaceae bacterium]|jgi:transglutaminase-like putative cysteine protease